jgi:uncharacterized membrane protein YhhN
MPSREQVRKLALGVFVVAALGVMSVPPGSFGAQPLCAGVPVFALLWRVALAVGFRRAWLILAALAVDSAGDVVLAVPGSSQTLFLAGMGLFLIGHLAYLGAFVPETQLRWRRLPVAVCVGAVALAASVVLLAKLGRGAIPILVYAGALSAMAIAAAFRRSSRATVLYGALLFILSDALVAVNRFVTRVPLGQLSIYGTYFAAQFLIAEGWARDRLDASSPAAVDRSREGG